jgi:ketosteroid isomerase-like protein
VFADGPDPGTSIAIDVASERWREQLGPWEDFRIEATEYRELDDERILVLNRLRGRGTTTGVKVKTEGGNVFHIHDGKVTRLILYWDSDRALADLGVEGRRYRDRT